MSAKERLKMQINAPKSITKPLSPTGTNVFHMEQNILLNILLYETYFRQTVDAGLHELNEGKGIGHKAAKEWLMAGFQ